MLQYVVSQKFDSDQQLIYTKACTTAPFVRV